MVLSAWYSSSAWVCSLCLAAFLGYLFSSTAPPFVATSTMGANWLFWGAAFSAFFLLQSFVPKWRWLYYWNAVILLVYSWLVYSLGTHSLPSVKENLFGVGLLAVYTFGGPLWLIIISWFWHYVACCEPFINSDANS